jgi:hypothetical protein
MGAILGSLLVFGGCAWVDVDPGAAQDVRVATPADVENCRRVGNAKARTKVKVGFVKRSREKVARELETLARNDAPEVGGDTVVPDGPVDAEGVQRFTIYDCSAQS